MEGDSSRVDYLEEFNRIDIVLAPFPYGEYYNRRSSMDGKSSGDVFQRLIPFTARW